MPLSARELKQTSSENRMSSGNPIFDEMANGGVFKDSIILVSGPTGGGKTLLSTIFAAEGCKNDETVLLLAYEESQPQLLRNAKAWGVDFNKWEREGKLKILCTYPESLPLENHLLLIQNTIDELKPRRVIIDSISALERVSNQKSFREFVIGLTSFCKQETVCTLFTSTTPGLAGGDALTEAHISTLTDLIVLLRYVEIEGTLRRGIAIIKMRGSQHDKQIHEFFISEKGLQIGEPFKNVHNIILGTPTSTSESELDRLEKLFASREE